MRIYHLHESEVRPGIPLERLPRGLILSGGSERNGDLRSCRPLYETWAENRANLPEGLTRTDESSYTLTELADEDRPPTEYERDVLLFYDSSSWIQSPELGDFSELIHRSPTMDVIVAKPKRTFLVPVLSASESLVTYEGRRPECLAGSAGVKDLVMRARRTERRRRKLTVLLSV